MEALIVVIVLGLVFGVPLAIGLAVGFAWGRRAGRRDAGPLRVDADPYRPPRAPEAFQPSSHRPGGPGQAADSPRPGAPGQAAGSPRPGAPWQGPAGHPAPAPGRGPEGGAPGGTPPSWADFRGGAGTGPYRPASGARRAHPSPYPPAGTTPRPSPAGPGGPAALINLGLYVASLLLITGSGLLVNYAAPAGVKVAGLWLLSAVYYGVGVALFLTVRRLRIAGISMTGTGLAVLPFAGLATWSLLFPDAASLIWLVTSLVGTVALYAACALMNSRVLGVLMVAFLVSVALSMVSTVGLGLVWYFAATTALATLLMLLVRLAPAGLPRSVLASIVRTYRLIVPASALATIFTAPWADAGQVCVAFAVFTLYAALFHVLNRTDLELIQLRAYPAVAAAAGLLWATDSWYWAGWGAWGGFLAASLSCGLAPHGAAGIGRTPGSAPAGAAGAGPLPGSTAGIGRPRGGDRYGGTGAGPHPGEVPHGGRGAAARREDVLLLAQAVFFGIAAVVTLWYVVVGDRFRGAGDEAEGVWTAARLLADPVWAPPAWLAVALTAAGAALWGRDRRLRLAALVQVGLLAVTTAPELGAHGLGPVWAACALAIAVLLARPAAGVAWTRPAAGVAPTRPAASVARTRPPLWLPSALALALGALAADVAPQPAGRHGLVVAVAALAVVALAQALLRRAADRPVGGIVVPVAASSALWVMGAVTLSAPSGAAGPSAVDVALLGVLLAAPAAVGAAVVAQLARIREAGRLPDGLAAAYLLAPLLTGLLLDLPAGARLAAGAVPEWAPGVVYGILLLTALGALLTRRAQAPSFWVLVTRVAVLPLTAELAVRLLDSGVGIAWTVTVVLLAQHAVSWAIQRRPPIATRDRVLAWILLGAQAATALLLWLLVPGGGAALSAAAMLLLTAAAAWVYEARRTIPGYALLPHVLAPAALAAADGASQALAPRTDQTAVLGALGILVAVLVSLSARILREGAGRGAGRPGAVGELVWLGLLFLGGIVPDRTGWVACIGLALAAWILLLLLRDAAPRSGAAAAGSHPLPMAELRRHVVVWTGLLILLRLLGYVFDGPQPVLWPLLAGVALMGLALGSRVEAPPRSRAYLWFAFGAETLAWLVSIADPAVGGPVAPLWGLGIPALLIAALVLGMVAAVLTRDTAAGWAWAALITAVLLWYARNLGPLLLIILALAITGAVIWFLLRTGRRS